MDQQNKMVNRVLSTSQTTKLDVGQQNFDFFQKPKSREKFSYNIQISEKDV